MTARPAAETHYRDTLVLFGKAEQTALEFGHSAIVDIDAGKTIRQMSIDLCGNEGLEDRIGRYIEAAKWDARIKRDNGQLYEDARTWLSVSHFTTLERYADRIQDYEAARDVMEQCLVRDVADCVMEVKPVPWLRGKVSDPASPTMPALFHRVWRVSAKLLADMQGELSRKGLQATRQDRRRVRLLSMMVGEFSAEKEGMK